MGNFVSYNNAQALMRKIGEKFETVEGAFVFRGSSTFANLPAVLTKSMVGNVYNVTNDFTIDNRFVEYDPLNPKSFPEGTDIAIADVSTTSYNEVTPTGEENPSEEGWYVEDPDHTGEYILTEDTIVVQGTTYYEKVVTAIYKFDVCAGFSDVSAITEEIEAMIADEFDNTQAYAIGDIVIYNNELYKFKTAHTANDPWDATEVDKKNIADLIAEAEPESLTVEQINALIALLD